MSDDTEGIVRDDAPATLRAICEANLAAYILHCAGTPQGARHDEPALAWGCSGIGEPFLNSVVRTHFVDAGDTSDTSDTSDAAAALDEAITATLAVFQQRALPCFWWIMPSTEPQDLAGRLLAHGLTHYRNLPAMTVDLNKLPETVATPPGTTITSVGDTATLRDWNEALGATLSWSPKHRAAFLALHEQLGVTGDTQPYHLYLARLDGVPVATSALLLGGGVAGIYWVSTRPEARRQGIGAAVTLAALQAARAHGYRLGTLQATTMGYPVYQRLGFTEQCRMGVYEWEP